MSAPTPEEIRRITEERLAAWGEKVIALAATPFCLIAVGHGEKSGNVVVCSPEGDATSNEALAALLAKVSLTLDKHNLRERRKRRKRRRF